MTSDRELGETFESLVRLFRRVDWENPGEVATKEGRDIVTEADLRLQEEIVCLIQRRYPEHNILAEEADFPRTSSPFTWVIDPVDGTINFSRNYPVFAVSVALVEGENPLFGVVYVPALDKLYTARRGKGAFCNEKAIHCGGVAKLERSLVSVILTSHYTADETATAVAIIREASMRTRGVRIMVCESAELCFIAEGILDGNVSIKADPYGAMAGKLILEEAGGRFSRLNGESFDLYSESILASNGCLHERLRKLCAPFWTARSDQSAEQLIGKGASHAVHDAV